MRYKFLSYPLSNKTPLYGKTGPVLITDGQRIAAGDSCNTAVVHFSNHSGTHIDFPAHFDDSGMTVSDYDAERFIYTSPQVLECPKKKGEMIGPEDLQALGKNTDLLIFRTGYYKLRSKKEYRTHNPGVTPEAAGLIREKYPKIRALGIDSISISSYQHRDLGREAHRVFLSKKGYRSDPVLLIEDLDLSGDPAGLKRVLAFPLIIEGLDGAPCTVIGEFKC